MRTPASTARALQRGLVMGLCLVAAPAVAWGDRVHGWLARHGLDALPRNACLRQWLQAQRGDALEKAAAEPDAWRNPKHPQHHPDEGPAHYLDVDAATPPESYPRTWPDVIARFGAEKARKLGRVPWRVEEVRAELVFRLREKDTQGAARAYAHLSHYVTDAWSPLHGTLQYNPRFGPEDGVGLHERYEALLWEAAPRLEEVGRRTLTRLSLPEVTDAREAIFAALLSGLEGAKGLTRADLEAKGALEPLYAAAGELTAERWAGALGLLAALTQSAWEEAGRPRLPGMKKGCDEGGPGPARP